MARLAIISNRLPVSISKRKGEFIYSESVGGVATGIASLEESKDRLWFGWPGISSDKLIKAEKEEITENLQDRGCVPVFVGSKAFRGFYSGFSNKTIWPLFHYFSELTVFDENYWKYYKEVNQKFCDEVIKYLSEDDIIWVHDYHLMLLPEMIRERMGNAQIGYFLHIPFPSFELIRNVPWRKEILEGILGADLIGFHEYDYVRHFLSSVHRICGYEHQLGKLSVGNRQVRVDAFPMGINFEKYSNSSKDAGVQASIKRLNRNETRVILSVDRLDYTKGILKRLEAYDWFLTKYPSYRGKVSLVMVAVPSRIKVEEYAVLRENIEKIVGRINGSYGSLEWTPILYLYRSLGFEELSALYNIADVALITPLRDGMNLVAKEFVATQSGKEQQGILILSEMAGAACELSESIVTNPHNKESLVQSIKDALEMPQAERRRRNLLMESRLSRYTVGRWASDFVTSLKRVKEEQSKLATKQFSTSIWNKAVGEYSKAEKRLIFLDYDGTLVRFFKQPEDAKPDKELMNILARLCKDKRNEVVIISGRDKDTLEEWFGSLSLNLVAEHGAFYKLKNASWSSQNLGDNEWKETIRPILELSVDRTAGSFIEEKSFGLVWHFRKSNPDLAKRRTQELKDTLVMMAANLNIGVFEGNKIIEVKPVSINKGQSIIWWLEQYKPSFVFCAGDDYTDEDMFLSLPESGYSCKIGVGFSNAKFTLSSPDELRKFLKKLS